MQEPIHLLTTLAYRFVLIGLVVFAAACSKHHPEQNHEISDGNQPASQGKALPEANENGVRPSIWPQITSEVGRDEAIEKRVASLLSKMTLEEKVGQMIQPEIGFVTPDDIRKYHFGSVLNGGGSFPNKDKYATAADWVALADTFYNASTDKSGDRIGIPIIWGSDAVHGHNNVLGATILPHNIGLGAANNPELMRRLGELTAKEVLATGLDWTFAPTVAVVRDDRWGRTYESYSEDPAIVNAYARQVVWGIQGRVSDGTFMNKDHVLANAKHYLGDGGTQDGRDQGDNIDTEEKLRDIHAAGYFSALEAGAQIVMVSFNSWKGDKLHGHKGLLTDVLKERMGFDGFVISDWNGHQQIPGCTAGACPAAINAGIDMVMVTEQWKAFFESTLNAVNDGEIPLSRIDDAVTRILRVKARAGVLDAPKPSERTYSRQQDLLGAEAHRTVAREAVRESLVLLKNNKQTLPIKPTAHVAVFGDGADNIGKQSGGWTLSWQGTGNTNKDFPNGQSIFNGIEEVLTSQGGSAELISGDITAMKKPADVALVVFGEDPYAEFQGDKKTLSYEDPETLNLLNALKEKNIPSVAVFLSGRPLYATPFINAADAFVAAWLPGSEGGGVADVLIGNNTGEPRFDFKGTLSFSWPKSPLQFSLNLKDDNYDPLFAYGYGLNYDNKKNMPVIEEANIDDDLPGDSSTVLFTKGRTPPPWKFYISNPEGSGVLVSGTVIENEDKSLIARLADREQQGDSQQFVWDGSASRYVSLTNHGEVDFLRESNGGMSLSMAIKVDRASEKPVTLTLLCGKDCRHSLDISQHLQQLPKGEWSDLRLPLNCYQKLGAAMDKIGAFKLESTTALDITFSDIRLVGASLGASPCKL